MKTRDLSELLLLAAIWGGSFLAMRLAVPAFGPVASIACDHGPLTRLTI